MVAPRASSARARERLMHMTALSIEMEKINLPKCMREIREVRGFTGVDIADVLNMTGNAYHYLEQGKTQVKVSQLVRLCQFYGITPNDFMGWRE